MAISGGRMLLVVLVLFSAAYAPPIGGANKYPFIYRITEEFILYNNGTSTYNLTSSLLTFTCPQNIPGQERLQTEVYINGSRLSLEEYGFVQNEDGAEELRITAEINPLPPGGMINITIVNIVGLNPSRRAEWQPRLDPSYMQETRLWNYSNPLVKAALEEIGGDTPTLFLYNVLEWMDSNLSYTSRIPGRHPWEVLEERAGDCDDRSNLLITLLRGRGIPAYLETGIIILPGFRAEGSSEDGGFSYEVIGAGFHGWVKAYINGSWMPVDTTFYVNATGRPSDHIEYSLYNMPLLYRLIVTGWVKRTDYVGEGAETLRDMSGAGVALRYVVRVEETGTH